MDDVVAIGGVGQTEPCDHLQDKWRTSFVKTAPDENEELMVKTYCQCGARLYRKVKLGPDDVIVKEGNHFVLEKKK